MNDGLLPWSEGHQAIVNVIERGGDLVSRAVVEGKARAHAVFILGVGTQLPSAEVTREVAASLGEDVRLAEEEVGQSIVGHALDGEAEGSRGEVSLIAVELGAAELRAVAGDVLALGVREVGAESEVVLDGVPRIDDGVADV